MAEFISNQKAFLMELLSDTMAKFDGIRGQELLEVEDKSERENEITLIFKDNRFLFIKLENGKMVTTSIPE
jgi:hypothetical protein